MLTIGAGVWTILLFAVSTIVLLVIDNIVRTSTLAKIFNGDTQFTLKRRLLVAWMFTWIIGYGLQIFNRWLSIVAYYDWYEVRRKQIYQQNMLYQETQFVEKNGIKVVHMIETIPKFEFKLAEGAISYILPRILLFIILIFYLNRNQLFS